MKRILEKIALRFKAGDTLDLQRPAPHRPHSPSPLSYRILVIISRSHNSSMKESRPKRNGLDKRHLGDTGLSLDSR